MPVNYVDISSDPYTQWSEVLEAIAGAIEFNIKPNITGARVYPYWVYLIDAQSMLGRVSAPMMASSGTSDGTVHCWSLGINESTYTMNQNGDPDVIGTDGKRIDHRLLIDVWNFRSYDGRRETQRAFLNEARLVKMAIARNAVPIQEGVDRVQRVSPLRYTALHPTPFSDGSQISVASGIMEVTVKDILVT